MHIQFVVHCLCLLCSAGSTWCLGRSSEFLRTSSLRTSQYCRSCIPLSVCLWNDLGVRVFDGVGLAGLKSRVNASLLEWIALSLFVFQCFLFLFLPSVGRLCEVWVLIIKGCIHSLPALHCRQFKILMKIIINTQNKSPNVYRGKTAFGSSTWVAFCV